MSPPTYRHSGFTPVRLAGVDRYDTAVKIANLLGDPPTLFEADGTNFPDGLSAGPAAALSHGAVLLTFGHVQAAETAAYIAAHPTDVRYAIGGPAAAADPTAQALVGADRYATSIAVARQLFASPGIVDIATGGDFADALSGGPVAGVQGAPMILVAPNGPLPGPVQSYFNRYSNTVLSALLFGGTSAVSTTVAKRDRAGTRARAVVVVGRSGSGVSLMPAPTDRNDCGEGNQRRHAGSGRFRNLLCDRRDLREPCGDGRHRGVRRSLCSPCSLCRGSR